MSITRPEIDFPGDEPPADLRSPTSGKETAKWHAQATWSRFTMSGSRIPPGKNSTQAGTGVILCSSGAAPGRSSPGWDQGVAGHEGRRPPSADHPAGSGLRRPRRRARDHAGRDPHLRVRPGFDLKMSASPEDLCPSRCDHPLFGRRTAIGSCMSGYRSPGSARPRAASSATRLASISAALCARPETMADHLP